MHNQTSKTNCVIEVYKGVKIWKYESLHIKIDPQTKKRIIDIAEKTGLSDKKIICNSSKPCSKCEGSFVEVVDTEGILHKIPRGLLSRKNLL